MFWEFVSFLELQVNMYLLRVIALLEYFIVVVRTFPAENYTYEARNWSLTSQVRPKLQKLSSAKRLTLTQFSSWHIFDIL